jgi:hypothetical protein
LRLPQPTSRILKPLMVAGGAGAHACGLDTDVEARFCAEMSLGAAD